MSGVILDTHALVWSLGNRGLLPADGRRIIADALERHVSAVSFYEIAQKVRLGKWPEMDGKFATLRHLWSGAAGITAAMTEDIACRAGDIEWENRDPFDRIIAATALSLGLPLLSKDAAFDDLAPLGLSRVW